MAPDREGWLRARALVLVGFPGMAIPLIKALKWCCATEARSSLRAARALRKWGERSETWFRCLSKKAAIGLKIAWPLEALVVAATVESRRAAWRGPSGSGGCRGGGMASRGVAATRGRPYGSVRFLTMVIRLDNRHQNIWLVL